jgi:hypothetical protein
MKKAKYHAKETERRPGGRQQCPEKKERRKERRVRGLSIQKGNKKPIH